MFVFIHNFLYRPNMSKFILLIKVKNKIMQTHNPTTTKNTYRFEKIIRLKAIFLQSCHICCNVSLKLNGCSMLPT